MKIINMSRFIIPSMMELDVTNLSPEHQECLDEMYALNSDGLTQKAIDKAVVFAVEAAKLLKADAVMIGGDDIIMPQLEEALRKAKIPPVYPMFSSIREMEVTNPLTLDITSTNEFTGWYWPHGEPTVKKGRLKFSLPFFKKKVAVATEADSLHAETQEAAV